MIPGTGKNPLDMILRAPKSRPTLEAMRRKLASALPAPADAANPSAEAGKTTSIQGPSRPLTASLIAKRRQAAGLKSLAAISLFTMALLGMHFLLQSHREEVLEAVGIQTFSTPLASPAGLSLDDRARFWAYAAFDAQRLRERFPVPASALIDPVDARHHLEDVLEQEVGAAARAEAMELRSRASHEASP